jgi:hypothetical protein
MAEEDQMGSRARRVVIDRGHKAERALFEARYVPNYSVMKEGLRDAVLDFLVDVLHAADENGITLSLEDLARTAVAIHAKETVE